MIFDWEKFFQTNRIDYKVGSSREIVIHCPWCGGSDPSHHLSINLDGKGFRCFRSNDHRGKNPARLVQILLRCSIDHARNMCGMATMTPLGGDLMSQVKSLFQPLSVSTRRLSPKLPEEFHPLRDKPSAWPFLSYMKSRGYRLRDTLRLAELFDLRYCKEGPFRGRIIFPVRRHGKLLNWTGRTIDQNTIPRYRTHTTQVELSTKLGLDPATEPISNLLLWHDLLERRDAGTLVITEGPFDALRVNHYGLNQGIIATCLFTMRASPTQVVSLREMIYNKFQRTILLLDRGTLDKAVSISLQIPELKIVTLPEGIKDPGNLDTESFVRLRLTTP